MGIQRVYGVPTRERAGLFLVSFPSMMAREFDLKNPTALGATLSPGKEDKENSTMSLRSRLKFLQRNCPPVVACRRPFLAVSGDVCVWVLAYFLNPREINSRLAPWHLGLISTRLKAYPPILDVRPVKPTCPCCRRSERGRNSMQAQTRLQSKPAGRAVQIDARSARRPRRGCCLYLI